MEAERFDRPTIWSLPPCSLALATERVMSYDAFVAGEAPETAEERQLARRAYDDVLPTAGIEEYRHAQGLLRDALRERRAARARHAAGRGSRYDWSRGEIAYEARRGEAEERSGSWHLPALE